MSAFVLNRTALCFLCDEGYLFPTLVAAKQAVRNLPSQTEVIIFLQSGSVAEWRKQILEAGTGATIRLMPSWIDELIDRSVPDDFFKTHVNKSALYRLFLGDLLSDEFDRIIYCDGDIQIRKSLAELTTFDLPQGMVGAVPDWVAHHSTPDMPYFADNETYLAGLSFEPGKLTHYFNSGIMVASPETWKAIGAQALQFLVANPGACRLHDQSALNHVCRDRTIFLPIRFNFLRQYMELAAFSAVDPAVVHFVGKIKPWDGPFAPWGRCGFQPYVDLYAALQPAHLLWRRKPLHKRLLTYLKSVVKPSEYADCNYRALIDQRVRDYNQWA